jgi:hypothetical protein
LIFRSSAGRTARRAPSITTPARAAGWDVSRARSRRRTTT